MIGVIFAGSAELQSRIKSYVDAFRVHRQEQGCGVLSAETFLPFLPTVKDPVLRRLVIYELIAADFVDRWRVGEKTPLKSYLDLSTAFGLGDISPLPDALLEIEVELAEKNKTSLDETIHEPSGNKNHDLQQPPPRTRPSGTLVYSDAVPIESDPRFATNINVVDSSPLQDSATTQDSGVASKGANRFGSNSAQEGIIAPEGGYRLVRQIGEGSFGEVWKAEAPGGVEVALKILRFPLGHNTSRLEMRALHLMKRLRHPFLLQVQAFWATDDRVLIAMELADQSLRDLAETSTESKVPLDQLLFYMREAAEGIDFLHGQHVMHRDIKPENILVLAGHVKVADFGLAKFLDESRLAMTATQQMGSPLYMAPETWSGQICPESDQYSLAVSYAELRMGKPPYECTSIVQVMQSHLSAKPNIAELSLGEQRVLNRAMAKKSTDRYASCTAFVHALDAAIIAEKNPPNRVERSKTRRMAVLFSLLAIAATASMIAAMMIPNQGPATPDNGIIAPSLIQLGFGQSADLDIKPRDLKNKIEALELSGLPPTIKLMEQDNRRRLVAELGANEQDYPLKLKAKTNYGDATASLTVKIIKPTNLLVPSQMEPIPSAIREKHDSRVMYQRLRSVDKLVPIEVILIPREKPEDPATFYIMETEVTNRQFIEFVAENPKASNNSEKWKQGAIAGDSSIGIKDDKLDYPVVNVTVTQANDFAAWVHGYLPTTQQWDKAAGTNKSDGRTGPFINDAKNVAVDRLEQGPQKVGTSTNDISCFGVRDMSGNVNEWTRTVNNSDSRVPLPNPLGTEYVTVRGSSYYHDVPWKFESAKDSDPEALRYFVTSSHTGFRVVFEVMDSSD